MILIPGGMYPLALPPMVVMSCHAKRIRSIIKNYCLVIMTIGISLVCLGSFFFVETTAGIWPYVQFVTVLIGYWMTRDSEFASPPLVKTFIFLCFIGSIIASLLLIHSIAYFDWLAVAALVVSDCSLAFSTWLSWKFQKALLLCPTNNSYSMTYFPNSSNHTASQSRPQLVMGRPTYLPPTNQANAPATNGKDRLRDVTTNTNDTVEGRGTTSMSTGSVAGPREKMDGELDEEKKDSSITKDQNV